MTLFGKPTLQKKNEVHNTPYKKNQSKINRSPLSTPVGMYLLDRTGEPTSLLTLNDFLEGPQKLENNGNTEKIPVKNFDIIFKTAFKNPADVQTWTVEISSEEDNKLQAQISNSGPLPLFIHWDGTLSSSDESGSHQNEIIKQNKTYLYRISLFTREHSTTLTSEWSIFKTIDSVASQTHQGDYFTSKWRSSIFSSYQSIALNTSTSSLTSNTLSSFPLFGVEPEYLINPWHRLHLFFSLKPSTIETSSEPLQNYNFFSFSLGYSMLLFHELGITTNSNAIQLDPTEAHSESTSSLEDAYLGDATSFWIGSRVLVARLSAENASLMTSLPDLYSGLGIFLEFQKKIFDKYIDLYIKIFSDYSVFYKSLLDIGGNIRITYRGYRHVHPFFFSEYYILHGTTYLDSPSSFPSGLPSSWSVNLNVLNIGIGLCLLF